MSKLLFCRFTVIYRELVLTIIAMQKKRAYTCLSFDNSSDMRIAVWTINAMYSYIS